MQQDAKLVGNQDLQSKMKRILSKDLQKYSHITLAVSRKWPGKDLQDNQRHSAEFNGLAPRIPVTNEGLGRDSLLKME